MKTTDDQPGSGLSARNSLRPANFFFNAPDAHLVQIAGDFNHWSAVPMQRRMDGWWHIQLLLCHGHHRYRFLVDGKPALDPSATGIERDESGQQFSLIAVS